MKFTCFATLYDTRPRTYSGWSEFVEQLNRPTITSNKHSVMLYSAAVYTDGAATRSNANVSHVSMGIADLDNCVESRVMDLLCEVANGGLAALFHTTHSFAEGVAQGKFKCRIIFPFDRIVEPDEWDRVWAGLREFCIQLAGCEIDPACKDPSRSYFFPSAPRAEDCMVEEFQGLPLEVDMLIELAPPDAARTSFQAPSPEALSRIESSTRFQLARAFLSTYEAAVEGDGGDHRTFRAACVGNDFALTKEEFWPLLLEYNTRCIPQWPEDELEKKLDNAIQYAGMPQGWRLVDEGADDAVTVDDITKLIAKLQKSESRAPTGRIMRAMVGGLPLTGRKPSDTLWSISDTLAQAFPQAAPKQLAQLFETSIEATDHRDINLDAFSTLIKGQQEDLQAVGAASRLQIHDAVASRYSQAFRAIGVMRRTPYTDEELETFKKQFPNPGESNQLWIVRHDATHYFRVGDQYVGPFNKDSFNAGKTLLSPSKVDFDEYSERGKRPRSMLSLVDEYGTVAHKVILDMTAQKSSYDAETFTMIEAPCPRRDIEPQYHHNVDRWVSALCGGNNELYARFLDWLACVPKLEQPICALVVYGAAQTGKSLLGSALARLYTTSGPTEIEDIVGNFNSMLAECPVALADETVPREAGKPNTRLLRKIITQHDRTFRRKNIPDAKLIGALRLVMTSNSLEGLIYQHDELNDHDIEALCERFLLVHVKNDAAKIFLDSLSPEARYNITHYTAIAEHVLWLWKNRKVTHGKRLLVEGFQDSELATALKAGTGLRPEVIEFVAEWLVNPQKIVKPNHLPTTHQLPDGRVVALMSAKTLKEHWESLLGDKAKVPRLRNLTRALEALSVTMHRIGTRTYDELDLKAIRKYAIDLGIDGGEFDEGMRRLGLTSVTVGLV